MIKLNPYLTFAGTAARAIELYTEVFQAEPTMVQKFKDMPPQEGVEMSSDAAERILHASFQIGNDMLMISDAPPGMDHTVVTGSQTQVSIHPDSKKEADRMFALLSEGGEVTMPMAMQFWGDYFGMCADKFGVRWMINYHEEQQ
jgi:PhnB protein